MDTGEPRSWQPESLSIHLCESMNHKFPPLNTQGGYSRVLGFGSSSPQENQGLDNDDSAHYGEVITERNYDERPGDFSHPIWSQPVQQKETDKRHIQPTVLASSYSKGCSPDLQGIPSGMADDLGISSCYQINQHPIISNMGHGADGERTAADRIERYNSLNGFLDLTTSSTSASHLLVQEKDQGPKRDSFDDWTSVIKETLEMDLEPAPSSRTSVVYGKTHRDARGLEPVKDLASVDYKNPDVQDKLKTEMSHVEDSSVLVLSGKSYKDVSPRTCTYSQDKLDYCSPSSDTSSHLSGQNLKLHMTQRPNFEHDSLNAQDNVDQLVQRGLSGSEMKVKCTTSENTKRDVLHSGFVLTERNWCSNTVTQCDRNSSPTSPTSISKLENFVNNLFKVIPPTSTLKSTKHVHVLSDCTNGHNGSSNKTSNFNKTNKTKEAASTPETVGGDVSNPQKMVKNQKMLKQWNTTVHVEAQEPSTFQDSADEPGFPFQDVPFSKANTVISPVFEKHISPARHMVEDQAKKKDHAPEERKDQSDNPEIPQTYSLENVLQDPDNVLKLKKTPQKITGQVQGMTCGSDSNSQTNSETLSLKKENFTERVCPTTSVSQCTRNKRKKPGKCCTSPKKTSSNEIRAQTTKPEHGAISVNEDKYEEQIGIKCQVSADESDNADNLRKSKRHKRMRIPHLDNANIFTTNKSRPPCVVSSACTNSTSVTKGRTTSNTENKTKFAKKTHHDAEKEKINVSCNLEEESFFCDVSKPLTSSPVTENSALNLSPRNTTRKLKNRKNPKNKVTKNYAQKCPISSTCDIKTSRSKWGIRRINDVNAASKAEAQKTLASVDSSRRSSRTRQNISNSSVQTRFRKASPHTCASPEHEQTILCHSVCTMETVNSEESSSNSNVCSSAVQSGSSTVQTNIKTAKNATLKNALKQRKTVASVENDVQLIHKSCNSRNASHAEHKSGSTPNVMKPKTRRLLNTASGLKTDQLEQSSSSVVLNFPQFRPVQPKKRGKKSKRLFPNFSVLSLRHSSRFSRFIIGKVNKRQNPDCSAADISLQKHLALSRKTRKQDIKRPQKHKKKCTRRKSNHKSLPKSNRDVTDHRPLNMAIVGQDQMKANEDCSHAISGRCLKLPKKNLKRVITGIRRRKRKFSQDQANATATELLDNRCSKVLKMQEENCFQKTHNLRSLRLSSKRRDNAVKKTDSICFEDPLKNKKRNEERNLRDDQMHSTKNAHSSKILVNTETEDVNFTLCGNLFLISKINSVKRRTCKNKTRMSNMKNKEATEPNDDADFEYSDQSSVNFTVFNSFQIADSFCEKTIKEEMSEEVRASDLERDVGAESSFANNGVLRQNSASHNVDGLECSTNDNFQTLNKGTCVAEHPTEVLPKKEAKKCIVCKYCGQYFHHISAYTVHQRIHTGEKPYRCRICGKNFAKLSKLRFHQTIHLQPEALRCPCCSKEFSQKKSLLSHFRIHLKGLRQKTKPDRDVRCKTSISITSPLTSTKNDQTLMCEICDHTFPSKFMLKIHMHMHEVENPLACKICRKEFQKPSQLLVHEKTHWPVKPYACSVCGKGFIRLKELKKHSHQHTGETPFSCSYCSHAFCDLSDLRAHQASNLCIVKGKLLGNISDIEGFLVRHGVDGQVNTPVFFKCQICKQLYKKWCQYTLHLETHTKSPPYLCFACGQTYENNPEVEFHCKVCCQYSGEEVACGASLSEIFHSDDPSSQKHSTLNQSSLQVCKTNNNLTSNESPSEEDSQTPNNSAQENDHRIPQAPEVTEASSLSEPVPLVTDVDLRCSLPSPTPSASNDSLECVEISPSRWKFKCPRCGQRYEKYRSLCSHMQTHSPGFRNSCGRCGKSFETRSRLWLHLRIHRLKGRWFSCSLCNIQFRFFGAYKEHLSNHAGERPFACPVCPETFVHAKSVKFHQASKVLQCDVCAKTFKTLRNLLKHRHLHGGASSHQCLPCNLSFTNNKILQEHLKTHNKWADLHLPDVPTEPLAFPHKCKKCQATFSNGDLLYAHQICHFRGQVYPANVYESTSPVLNGRPHPHTESRLPSTSRSLISTLNLDAIPNDKSLYTYPHPDKLYVRPRRCRLQDIRLDSEDKNLKRASAPTSANTRISEREQSGQRMLEITQLLSDTDNVHLPQASERSPEFRQPQSKPTDDVPTPCTVTGNTEDKATHNSETRIVNFVETVFLEGLITANLEEGQDESFECVDCSYKTSRLLGLHEHYFLHALGNIN